MKSYFSDVVVSLERSVYVSYTGHETMGDPLLNIQFIKYKKTPVNTNKLNHVNQGYII